MGKVLHASGSGYFPFCIGEIDLSIPELYSMVSIEAVMKIWWRIKKIRFYGTYTQRNNGNPIDVPWELIVQRNAANEENLVCNPFPSWNTISQLNITDGSFTTSSVSYKGTSDDRFILAAAVGGALEDVLQEQSIPFVSIPVEEGSQKFVFEGISFTNTPPEFTLPGSINYQILEYWSYGGTYNTSTGLPL
jgi:hypothetical protein